MASNVRFVDTFPTMKPKGVVKTAEAANDAPKAAASPAAEPDVACCCAPVEEKIDFSNVEIEPLFQDFVDFETFSKSDFRAVKEIGRAHV